jgi:hypothetical protein
VRPELLWVKSETGGKIEHRLCDRHGDVVAKAELDQESSQIRLRYALLCVALKLFDDCLLSGRKQDTPMPYLSTDVVDVCNWNVRSGRENLR